MTPVLHSEVGSARGRVQSGQPKPHSTLLAVLSDIAGTDREGVPQVGTASETANSLVRLVQEADAVPQAAEH